jgi:hypothetical protein
MIEKDRRASQRFKAKPGDNVYYIEGAGHYRHTGNQLVFQKGTGTGTIKRGSKVYLVCRDPAILPDAGRSSLAVKRLP